MESICWQALDIEIFLFNKLVDQRTYLIKNQTFVIFKRLRIMKVFSFLIFALLLACSDSQTLEAEPAVDALYFPPLDNSQWETVEPNDLGWNTEAIDDLETFLIEQETKAFIVLKDGRIAIEKYYGNDFFNREFTRESQWYWASAGKSLTAFLTGIAQNDGLLNIDDRTSDYLGNGWTTLTPAQENLITLKTQLQMTTGFDYDGGNLNCKDPICLNYKADAGSEWYYYNAPYLLLHDVIENASGTSYNQFTTESLSATGINGSWRSTGGSNVFWSRPLDAARFGLLNLNNGNWNGDQLVSENFFTAMTTTSQQLNPSYGYLWWINGTDSTIFPGFADSFNRPVVRNAPDDMYSALGKNGQIIDVVPSMGLVIIRMGNSADDDLVPIQSHDLLWERINAVIN